MTNNKHHPARHRHQHDTQLWPHGRQLKSLSVIQKEFLGLFII